VSLSAEIVTGAAAGSQGEDGSYVRKPGRTEGLFGLSH
jgi:hypothetical protein